MNGSLEQQLDHFDAKKRNEALAELVKQVKTGAIPIPQAGRQINLHCHTFYSFNSLGYSPSRFAWLAKKQGLAAAGIVDFDVLDGMEEFFDACDALDLKGCVGIETRVYVPEFADLEMSSPGEPGITYHMGAGMVKGKLSAKDQAFLDRLKKTAQQRNRQVLERVNPFLHPVVLNYENDVLPLTPAENPTERHLCLAYARKAAEQFGTGEPLKKFWSEKLGTPVDKLTDLPEGANLLNAIRAKTMKQGGVGYVTPDPKSFPAMTEMNAFVKSAGGIPTHAWLNGLSNGEKKIEDLLEIGMGSGVSAFNIVPDRNYTPGVKDEKLANLYAVVELAERLHLPISVGTEMNSPGQKFVDSFSTAELKPLLPVFLKGAHIMYGHTLMQQLCGMGYESQWAQANFKDRSSKNAFYEAVGEAISPSQKDRLSKCSPEDRPKDIISKIS